MTDIIREDLLTIALKPKQVQTIEVKRVTLQPSQAAGTHVHPCPVVGSIVTGTVLFQIDGQPTIILQAGDAFFEPANTQINHFDAQAAGATFIANYLLGENENELIRVVE